MTIKHTLLLTAALLLSLPAASALADKGSKNRSQNPLKYKSTRSTKASHKGKVRSRGGMASRVKAWQRRNWRTKKKRTKYGSIARRTVKRRGSRTTRVWHKRSYETKRGTRSSRNRVSYRLSGRRFSRGTIATLVRAGLLRRGKSGQLFVLGSRSSSKVKHGKRGHRSYKRFRLFSGRRISRGDLKKLWKLASRTRPNRYPHGNIPLAKLWKR